MVLWLVGAPALAGDVSGDLDVLMETLSVSGREQRAAATVVERLSLGGESGGLGELVRTDRAGNVVLSLGRGAPRRLLACGLDEPGLIVTEIREDGYLRVRPAGVGARGSLWTQSFEGQKVWISTAEGRVSGAVTIPSVHLVQDGPPADEALSPGGVYVDVGAESAAEVREQGIEILDPIGLQQRVTRVDGVDGDGAYLAGPSAQSKAACAAVMATARGLAAGSVEGTLVVAWLRYETWNRKGIEYLIDNSGPFDEVMLASRGFGWSAGDEGTVPAEVPDLGTGPIAAGDLLLPGAVGDVAHLSPSQAWYTGGPDWGSASIGYYAVPARYRDSPVEMVARPDVTALAEALVAWGGSGSPIESSEPSVAEPIVRRSAGQHVTSASALAEMIGEYGVSTREEGIRRAVRDRLPDWAEPMVDARGNLLVRFGDGDEHVAFVAHLDEVGFTVDEILDDGRLKLTIQGGLAPSAWEGQSAIVHTAEGPVRGVFEPRQGWLTATARRPGEALTVFIGRSSKAAVVAAGVGVGDAVTMPKRMRRLGRHRAVARSFDDRVGTTAQLLALARIDPDAVRRRYTFAWVVEEEIGLFGSVALADSIEDLDRVHPVDTFVSSDDPYPNVGFALTPLGQGVVLRAMDNGYLADPESIGYVRELASAHGIETQIGFTGGGNDGIAFLHRGVPNMPISWPGRYSHSPAEVMDLRDLESLVDLIVALVEDPPG